MIPVYKIGHMKLWFAAVFLGVFFTLDSFPAKAPAPRKPLDPLALTCLLREGKFFSEIGFTKNSEDSLAGELGHYLSTPDHGRRFLGGMVFFDMEVEPRLIQGSTGDKRGNISAFRLYPAYRSLNGEWIYEQFDGNTPPSQIRFICKYRG
jgi:hypothetical protein